MNFLRTVSVTALSIILFYNTSFTQVANDDPFDVNTDKELVIGGIGVLIGTAALIVNANNEPLNINEIDSLKTLVDSLTQKINYIEKKVNKTHSILFLQ